MCEYPIGEKKRHLKKLKGLVAGTHRGSGIVIFPCKTSESHELCRGHWVPSLGRVNYPVGFALLVDIISPRLNIDHT